MSELGEWLGYTNEACPKCGRMRVESWSSGKLVCEKCHWSILDNEYHREVDSYIDDIRDNVAAAFHVPKSILDEEIPCGFVEKLTESDYEIPEGVVEKLTGVKASVIISAHGLTVAERMRLWLEEREQHRKETEERLAMHKDRADRLGIDIYHAEEIARAFNISVDEYLHRIECLSQDFGGDTINTFALYSPRVFVPESEWTDAQIRKQLKYEKNPMRVKQLNKMLGGKRIR